MNNNNSIPETPNLCQEKISVHSTHIILPSGSQLALDSRQSFSPNQEFWALWRSDKLAVKRAGIHVTKEGSYWRGYVRSKQDGFSYTTSDLHALWTERARDLATGEPIPPVIVPSKNLPDISNSLCFLHDEFEVVATVCSNGTFQLRLRCEPCKTKTAGAIKWESVASDVVIRSIARALQLTSKDSVPKNQHPIFAELEGRDWV